MDLARSIALRYLFSKKSHSAVNVISAISVGGVAVATAAIVIVLSVFNGFSDLAVAHFSRIDPDLLVTPARGKTIARADSMAGRLAALEDVAAATPVLTERGLLTAGDRQTGVVFTGVDRGYEAVTGISDAIIDGTYTPSPPENEGLAEPLHASVGVASHLGIYPGSGATLYVPRRVGRINPANPAASFSAAPLVVNGVIQIDQMEYDADHIVVPLVTARRLLHYDDGEASAICVAARDGDVTAARRAVSAALGPDFTVADRYAQHASSYSMIAVEKWVTFLMLIFILVIAAFNIVSTLSLMVIEKRDNMDTLRFLGAPRGLVRRVFMVQGAVITIIGGVIGVVLGIALALAQQWGGFIRLAGDPGRLAVSVYPVRVAPGDVAAVLAMVVALSCVTALITLLFTCRYSTFVNSSSLCKQ